MSSSDSTLRSLFTPLTDAMVALGDWSLFSMRACSGVLQRAFRGRELLRVAFEVGYSSAGVVGVTGLFIGMVLAVQAYGQFHTIGLETSLGAVIHMSVVRELGPVLAAVMLAGRVGSAMAAELATMRVTEQLDALACLGVDPVKYLVAPRLIACVLLLPLLTVLADLLGLAGSTLISLHVYRIDSYHYWRHTQEFVKVWDVCTGLVKAIVFGGVLSLIACHRGFHGRAGAEGVGRAATESFVWSFIAILVIDLFMAMFANSLYAMLWPATANKVA
ncbi:MAG: ABC transporter permease [Planctomycetaceae bacterium]|nr:ABC transporter permease [Planctomycetaceae bacterium]